MVFTLMKKYTTQNKIIKKTMEEIKQKIITLTRKKMRESGEYNREAFREFLEESVDFYISRGEISEEENIDLILDELSEMYNHIEEKEGDEA